MKSKVSQNGKHTTIKTGLQVTHGFLLQLDVQSTDQSKSNFKLQTSWIHDLNTHKIRIGEGIQTDSSNVDQSSWLPQPPMPPKHQSPHNQGHPEMLWCQHMQQPRQHISLATIVTAYSQKVDWLANIWDRVVLTEKHMYVEFRIKNTL
jgi:hypothetical protein